MIPHCVYKKQQKQQLILNYKNNIKSLHNSGLIIEFFNFSLTPQQTMGVNYIAKHWSWMRDQLQNVGRKTFKNLQTLDSIQISPRTVRKRLQVQIEQAIYFCKPLTAPSDPVLLETNHSGIVPNRAKDSHRPADRPAGHETSLLGTSE